MAAILQLLVEAVETKPSGSCVTRFVWLIKTFDSGLMFSKRTDSGDSFALTVPYSLTSQVPTLPPKRCAMSWQP